MRKYKNYILMFTVGILLIILHLRYDKEIPCFFYELTGLYCPGCGITRALFSLMRLDVYQAFRYNMLVVTLLPIAIGYMGFKIIFKKNKKIPNYVWNILLIITIIFGIFRNIPAFSFLAPTLIR